MHGQLITIHLSKNLANKGIDNIITDEPVMAREVVYSRNTSETITNMIKYVFNK